MMRDGAVSEHPTWKHHTSETAGFVSRGGWPTPMAGDAKSMSLQKSRLNRTDGIAPAILRSIRDGHTQMPQQKKWYTPVSHDAKNMSLPPAAIDRTDGVVGPVMKSIKAGHVQMPQERPYLSADWVEMLMGFPAGWTLLDTNGQQDPDHSPSESHPASEENSPEIGSD
jgi:hypothetical protein